MCCRITITRGTFVARTVRLVAHSVAAAGLACVVIAFAAASTGAQTPTTPASPTVAATPGVAPATPAAATPFADSMIVSALVPLPAGTAVQLEALNVQTSQPVVCAEASSVPNGSSSTDSAVRFVVDRASCVTPNSGDRRICWGPSSCHNFSFQAGATVDLGLLTATPPASTAPNPGGTAASPPSDSETVSAIVPVPAGTTVRLDVVVDPHVLNTTTCDTTVSVADPSFPSDSRVTFTILHATCIAPNSGNLRICWTQTKCDNFFFEAGKTVDLGVLPRPIVTGPPNTGGLGDKTSGSNALALDLRYAAVALFAIGACGLAASVLMRRRPR